MTFPMPVDRCADPLLGQPRESPSKDTHSVLVRPTLTCSPRLRQLGITGVIRIDGPAALASRSFSLALRMRERLVTQLGELHNRFRSKRVDSEVEMLRYTDLKAQERLLRDGITRIASDVSQDGLPRVQLSGRWKCPDLCWLAQSAPHVGDRMDDR